LTANAKCCGKCTPKAPPARPEDLPPHITVDGILTFYTGHTLGEFVEAQKYVDLLCNGTGEEAASVFFMVDDAEMEKLRKKSKELGHVQYAVDALNYALKNTEL